MLNQGMLTSAPPPAIGRPKRAAEAYYTLPGFGISSASTGSLAQNVDIFAPIYVATPIVVDQLAFEVVTLQTGNARMGLYAADRDYQATGAPLADSGDISTGTTGVKTYAPALALVLPAGRYVTVINTDAVTPALTRIFITLALSYAAALGVGASFQEGRIGRTYAAFPTPGATWTSDVQGNSTGSRVILRVSQP